MKEYAHMVPVHEIVLGIYKEFQKICEKYNLRYYAISGTTLGAVLWNGIIPWDDDMDIALPAEDYKKLIKLYQKGVFPKHISFTEYLWFGGKIHDNRTTFTNVYYIDKPGRFTGVSIDIVPLINVPNEKIKREKFAEELKKFHKSGILFDRYGIMDGIKSEKELLDKRKMFLNQYKFGETKFVMDFSDHRYILDAKGFEKPELFTFEDTTIPVSSGYKKDLTIQYGKYSKYPPKETRESFHEKMSIVDLETPYIEYENALKEAPEKIKTIIKTMHTFEGINQQWLVERDRFIEWCIGVRDNLQEENTELKGRLQSRRYKVVDRAVDTVKRISIKNRGKRKE